MIHQTVDAMAVRTRGRGFYEITREVQHPDVRRDFDRFFARLVPDGDPLFIHTMEGDDDMPAHVRTALTTVNLSIPIAEGRLALGTWQGIYVWEHRGAAHPRGRRPPAWRVRPARSECGQ